MNYLAGIILAVIGAALSAMSNNWLAVLWGIAAAGWAASAYLQSRNVERHKALALRRGWPQHGTVKRVHDGGHEVWDGQKWVKV